ncbi:unnamed protein product [Adineta ricciae]|uniref:Uncharacterized protein n=1 Tax=Adineta ricciae TaxID=249248 RepID=A0A815CPI1_ADIRI|nr:unnamed protein product [Adineta ricciae]
MKILFYVLSILVFVAVRCNSEEDCSLQGEACRDGGNMVDRDCCPGYRCVPVFLLNRKHFSTATSTGTSMKHLKNTFSYIQLCTIENF